MATLEENPLTEGLERLPVPPTTMTIFGGTGDLARRKLLPAIYNLAHEGGLPEQFNLVGISRGDLSDDAYRELAREAIRAFSRRPPDGAVLDALLARVRHVRGSFDDPAVYERVEACASAWDEEAGMPLDRLY